MAAGEQRSPLGRAHRSATRNTPIIIRLIGPITMTRTLDM